MCDVTQTSVGPSAGLNHEIPTVAHEFPVVEERGCGSVGSITETNVTRRNADAWENRATEAERARAQVVRRMQAARRDVYDANVRAEEAEVRATQAEAAARAAEARAIQAEAVARGAKVRAANAESVAAIMSGQAKQAQIDRERAMQERDVVLRSTAWRATWPVRMAGQRLPRRARNAARVAATLVWWSITLKLPRRLREQTSTRVSHRAGPGADEFVTSIRHTAAARPVTATPIECYKVPLVRAETAVFVAQSPEGHLSPHIRGYLEALVREGIGSVLIVAADRGFVSDEPP
jgi:hypothetical protein